MEPPKKERSVVLHPRTAAARRYDRQRGRGRHVRGHTIDDTSVLDLVRQQARTALLHFALIVGSIMGFLALIVIVPGLRTARPFDLPPLPWLVLGPVALFSTALVAFRHERRARHIEDRWSIDHRETSR